MENASMKVLLVDDESICHMSMTSFAKKLNVALDGAKSGAEAIEKVKSNTYNLILMDMIMPEMDGKQTCQTMRELPECINNTIIAMSAGIIVNNNSFNLYYR